MTISTSIEVRVRRREELRHPHAEHNRCQTTGEAGNCSAAQTGGMHGSHHEPSAAAGGVWRAAHSGGKTTLYLTPMHAKANLLKPLIAKIQAALLHVKAVAERFNAADP